MLEGPATKERSTVTALGRGAASRLGQCMFRKPSWQHLASALHCVRPSAVGVCLRPYARQGPCGGGDWPMW